MTLTEKRVLDYLRERLGRTTSPIGSARIAWALDLGPYSVAVAIESLRQRGLIHVSTQVKAVGRKEERRGR